MKKTNVHRTFGNGVEIIHLQHHKISHAFMFGYTADIDIWGARMLEGASAHSINRAFSRGPHHNTLITNHIDTPMTFRASRRIIAKFTITVLDIVEHIPPLQGCIGVVALRDTIYLLGETIHSCFEPITLLEGALLVQ